ncbi:MAG: hypothetical protein CMJ25_13315 [Phycisphaerae bacterium]|nr:hypothetical protein [Phycisphaerae bacterium]
MGSINLRARSGWVWREGSTHRMQLLGDVQVQLADSTFVARSACLWLRKLGQADGMTRYQVYAVFEDTRSTDGTMTMQAQRLPVRGVIELSQPLMLALDARFDQPPKPDSQAGRLRQAAEQVFAQRVLGIGDDSVAEASKRPWSAPTVAKPDRPTQRQAIQQGKEGVIPPNNATPSPRGPVFDPDGVFSISIGGRVVIAAPRGGSQSIITADGGVRVQYQSPSTKRWVDFRAERIVIYTRGDEPISGVSEMGTGQIEGIYLEGGVFAGDDQWSVRSPRMYLDVVNNKALMLDTVFWTVDQHSEMPLYVRAESVRQTASDEFRAHNATISNTAFFEPDVTLGINDIRVSLEPDTTPEERQDPRPNVLVEAKSVTLRAGPVPLLWLPGFKGDPGDFPLRQIKLGDSDRSGLAIQTRWNAFSLFNIDAPPGVELDLNLDYYEEGGIAFGLESQWQTSKHKGSLFSYLIPDDNGEDVTASGRRIQRNGETRGMFAFHDLWRVTNQWTVISELSYVSDEAFVPAFFEDMARTTEAMRNRIVLERLSDDSLLSLELSTTVNDFIVPEHQLQSPGYSVSKTPEASFVTLGKDLLPDIEPGLLTYSFEASAGLLRLSFSEVQAREYGFLSNSLADDAFGTTASESLGDKFRAMGLDEGSITRLDTRHELSSRFDLGHLRINPFLVGRVTAYDDDFAAFSPGQTDDVRYWGSAGVTFSTTISKVDDGIESRLLDLHRIRHIIEPSLTIWGSDSNFDANDLPIFDDDVEGLINGTSIRAAIDQTWQTKRGGIGRWRDVDLIKLRTEYVNTDADSGSVPIPEYFSSRPELSNPGEYLSASMVIQPTEALALAGEWVYDLDLDQTAKSSIGVILENRPGFTTSLEYRTVQPLDATFATLSARYRLSEKYVLNASANYNFRLEDFQTFNTVVLRRFQVGTLGATIRYNNIRGETSIGFIFRPLGSSNDLPIDPTWGG